MLSRRHEKYLGIKGMTVESNFIELPPGVIKKRAGIEFVASVNHGIERLEVVQRGEWAMVKVHLSDGTVQYIQMDGEPVLRG